MAKLSLRNIRKNFLAVEVLKGIDIDIDDGEFLILVGPSGCGKSTLMNIIAGLDDASSGEVVIGDRVVNDVSPKDRDIAMVFQSYALYPSMTVRENIEFAMRMRKVPKAEMAETVARVARILQMDQLLDRRPAQLSGGQRQRVAIGRAIVREPKLFLFDEPLSNLDAELRVSMRAELRELHARLKSTMVYVTHDQVEAMTMADKIVVLRGGRIEQVGRPLDLYNRPANTFVAGFIGSPRMNFLPAGLASSIPLPAGTHSVGIRPEHAMLDAAGPVTLEVAQVEQLGGSSVLRGTLHGESAGTAPFELVCAGQTSAAPGARVRIALPAGHLHCFDSQGVRVE